MTTRQHRPPMLDWVTCPTCGRDVPNVGGVVGVHMTPKDQRRWPKLVEECQQSGRLLPGIQERSRWLS